MTLPGITLNEKDTYTTCFILVLFLHLFIQSMCHDISVEVRGQLKGAPTIWILGVELRASGLFGLPLCRLASPQLEFLFLKTSFGKFL